MPSIASENTLFLKSALNSFILFVLLCAACSSAPPLTPLPTATLEALWQNPLPTPQFITHLTVIAGQSRNEQDICVSIHEAIVWEAGDYDSAVYRNIRQTSRITLDGNQINNVTFSQLTTLLIRYDNQQNVLGTHGGGVSACFDIPNPTSGYHLARIEFASTSGVQYAHEWVIQIP